MKDAELDVLLTNMSNAIDSIVAGLLMMDH